MPSIADRNAVQSESEVDSALLPTLEYQKVASKHITKAVGRFRDHVFVSGQGLKVVTSEGKELLDFTAGIGVTSLGHCHPAVTSAIIHQAQQIIHVQCAIALSDPYVKLVKNLVQMTTEAGPGLDSVFLWNSGSEAIEAAIKVVRMKTRRNNIIVMQGAYHGRTSGAAALTRSKTNFFAGTGPLMPCVYTTAYPFWHAMGLPVDTPEQILVDQAIHQLKQVLAQQTAPEDTAAIFIEPVIGEGGYVPCPHAYLRAIREVCDEHGILMVVDEIQTGFGRTGKMFAIEHSGVVPDLMVIAKGFANGMPLSGIITRKDVMDCMPAGSLGGTYSGNAVACAAAVATTDVMMRTNLLSNVGARSDQIFAGLRAIAADETNGGWMIAEVRGLGLMIAIEFKDPSSPITRQHVQGEGVKLPPYLNKLVQDECYARDLVILTTSIYPVLRLVPALIVSEEEAERALRIVKEAIKAVSDRVLADSS